MIRLTVLVMLLSVASVGKAQQPPVANPTSVPTPAVQQSPQKEPPTYRAELFQKSTAASVFIYGTDPDPCKPVPEGFVLLPAGSGFVTGVEKRGASTPQMWNGWKFLITAKHVVLNRSEIIVRVNANDSSKFLCKTIELQAQGPNQNVVLAKAGIDLAAIVFPEIEGYTATVVPSFMVMDEQKMQEWSIGVGTEVFTVGYLYGYSGQKANYPVTKFGHISMMSEESWYYNETSKLFEQGYVLDLSNAPGLSGSPVLAHGVEIEVNPLRYRELPPYLIGVVKAMMTAPVGSQRVSQGVAIIEPASNLRALMKDVAEALKRGGANVEPIN